MNTGRLPSTARWAVVFSILAAIVFTYRHWIHVNPTTVALTLVLFVLILAAQGELRYAVAASVAATAAYNFYFLPPVGTFRISDPQNWVALFAFLGTSIVGSRLSRRARDEAATALSRQRELEVLYFLSRRLLQSESVADAVQTLPGLVNASALAESVVLYLLDQDQVHEAGSVDISTVDIPDMRQKALTLSSALEMPGNEVFVPLRTGSRSRGLLAIRGAALTIDSMEAVAGLVCITLDHAQAIEDAARSEASKESERLRTLILDSITHELRTPLTSIKGAAGALLADAQMSVDNRQELVSIVDEEADRLDYLVGQAVEMARLEAPDVQMHLEAHTIAKIVRDAQEECSWVASSHALQIDVPKQPKVYGDRKLLAKVVCNLLENAAKYSKQSSQITVTAEVKDGFLATHITDFGVGIAPSEQGLIFDRLYRSKTGTEGTSGTGMGLAICRAIIEAHHGILSVKSQPGQGSIFTFTLPLADESAV